MLRKVSVLNPSRVRPKTGDHYRLAENSAIWEKSESGESQG